MSVLVFAGSAEGKVSKSALEAVSYGAKVAANAGSQMHVVAVGNVSADELAVLGNYGATNVLHNSAIDTLQPFTLANTVVEAAGKVGAEVIVFSYDDMGKAVAPVVSAKMKAGLVASVVDYPDTSNGFTVKRTVFSGKAFAQVKINSDVKIIGLLPNSVGAIETEGNVTVEAFAPNAGDARITLKEVKKEDLGGQVPLPEAELVVSAGRGMKGPENWGIIEELATELGATTACSRPVSDADWRPHHEHVGQTGLAIRPNLYIAVGISGAIQHLAGVNGSKVIVVINTDPEAPFFKAADYGIVGDAFEVVPKLIEAVKQFKANN